MASFLLLQMCHSLNLWLNFVAFFHCLLKISGGWPFKDPFGAGSGPACTCAGCTSGFPPGGGSC